MLNMDNEDRIASKKGVLTQSNSNCDLPIYWFKDMPLLTKKEACIGDEVLLTKKRLGIVNLLLWITKRGLFHSFERYEKRVLI